jgi:ethanolamine transporter EutH
MRKIVLTFGLIAGGILAATFLISLPFHDAIGFDRAMVLGYTSMVLAFLLIFFGVRSYRDHVAGGRLSFGRALAVGVLIGVVASCCYVLTWEVIYFGTKSDYIEKYQAHMIEKARQAGQSPEAIAAKQAEMAKFAEMYRNPLINSAMTFMEPLPVALVVALVSAGVLSRRKKAEPGPATS